MTLVEAVVIVALIALLASMLLPGLVHAKSRRHQGSCYNNLRQIGAAFRVWAGDYDDKYPMEVSVTNGGSKEFVNTPQAFQHFNVLSNDLGLLPILLICPSDSTRRAAKGFGPGFCNSNLSYFINVSATTNSDPFNTILCGDRNITPVGNRLFVTQSNQVVKWDASIHKNRGWILYADGSAVEITQPFRCSGETLSIP